MLERALQSAALALDCDNTVLDLNRDCAIPNNRVEGGNRGCVNDVPTKQHEHSRTDAQTQTAFTAAFFLKIVLTVLGNVDEAGGLEGLHFVEACFCLEEGEGGWLVE